MVATYQLLYRDSVLAELRPVEPKLADHRIDVRSERRRPVTFEDGDANVTGSE